MTLKHLQTSKDFFFPTMEIKIPFAKNIAHKTRKDVLYIEVSLKL